MEQLMERVLKEGIKYAISLNEFGERVITFEFKQKKIVMPVKELSRERILNTIYFLVNFNLMGGKGL